MRPGSTRATGTWLPSRRSGGPSPPTRGRQGVRASRSRSARLPRYRHADRLHVLPHGNGTGGFWHYPVDGSVHGMSPRGRNRASADRRSQGLRCQGRGSGSGNGCTSFPSSFSSAIRLICVTDWNARPATVRSRKCTRVYQWAPLTMGWCLDCHRGDPEEGDVATDHLLARAHAEAAAEAGAPAHPVGRQANSLYR